jgi:dolichyl-diphosphooligosaccharide--protein glycosyltransferase
MPVEAVEIQRLMKLISPFMVHIVLHIMDLSRIRQKDTALIIIIILAFALLGLWLRLLPMDYLTSGSVPKVIFMDPWYSLRQIEVIASNFPMYPWFDPMIEYPIGKDIDWGPLYPTISAAFVILFGATTRADIVMIASWIPPIFSLFMVPIMYFIGKTVAGRNAGIIGACLISVISGEYLYRSFFGYLDHHFFEVLLSTAFILFYLIILRKIHTEKIYPAWKNKKVIAYSALAGIIYYAGMMNMPTIILFAMIIGVFCIIHAMISRDEKSLHSLFIVHSILFGLFIVLYSLTGIHREGFNLSHYTPVHILLGLCLIIEPLFLLIIIRLTSDRPRWQSAGAVIGIAAIISVVIAFMAPQIMENIIAGLHNFFLASFQGTLINEMQMWDISRAFTSFNISLIVMASGILLSVGHLARKYSPVSLCALIWAFIILFSTCMHLRYEYYAAVIVVLYSAIALSNLYDYLQKTPDISILSKKEPDESVRNNPVVSPKTYNKGVNKKSISGNLLPFAIIGIIVLIITVLSVQVTWAVATKDLKIISMDEDWADALTWLGQNSPDTGIDYLKIYDKDEFAYPKNSYGVLSTWDYGHWIASLAKRLPTTTPFQNNVPVIAQFLLSPEEKKANILANKANARYIIADYEMLGSKFPTLPLWGYGPDAREQYQTYYFQQSDSNKNMYEPVLSLKPDYFRSMLSRLYIFDGSQVMSTGSSLIRYENQLINGETIPVISQVIPLSPKESDEKYAKGIDNGTELVSIQYTRPIISLPALTQYRLVYESPTRLAADEYVQLYKVKIFERVHGYQISGNGTLELPLITNQGRNFVYRQESTNGMFTLPYSTQREGNGVKATGPYKNIITGETYEVSESQVLSGI